LWLISNFWIRIRLPVGKSIEDVVDEFDADWHGNNTVWDGKSSPWSEIKEVFVSLHYGKCAYCERLVQAELQRGKVQSDIEHFRPKKEVKPWSSSDASLVVQQGVSTGYSWLATNVANYIFACKECNSIQKGNYFPIAGKAGSSGQSVRVLNTREKPFLLNPLDDLDDDPEDLIDWVGFVPVPKFLETQDLFRYQRARVIIELFALDERQDVRRGCAEQIQAVWKAFKLQKDVDDGVANRALLKRCKTENTAVHAACIRAFIRLLENKKTEAIARTYAVAAENYLAEIKDNFVLKPKPKKPKRSRKSP
jgi:5-methylcytosine-specific restriction endonuclease McrA